MRRRLTAAAAVLAATAMALAVAAPAQAKDRWTYRSTGEGASVEWVEFGQLPGGVEGNVHLGFLDVENNDKVWGKVTDWTCPEGELPDHGGGHGKHGGFDGEGWDEDDWDDEKPEGNCEFHSKRFIHAFGDQISFSMDKKLNQARLTGVLNVESHDGPTGRPPVDITWVGVGSTSKWSYTSKYTSGGWTYYEKEDGTSRQAVIGDGSFIGAMGFTDDADDQSSGYLSRRKYYERGSSR